MVISIASQWYVSIWKLRGYSLGGRVAMGFANRPGQLWGRLEAFGGYDKEPNWDMYNIYIYICINNIHAIIFINPRKTLGNPWEMVV